jgi:hypothetical protein
MKTNFTFQPESVRAGEGAACAASRVIGMANLFIAINAGAFMTL